MDREAKELLKNSTLADVAEIALEITRTKTILDRGKVSKMVDLLQSYMAVFDVLSQAGDCGFLAIIWGGMRMMLMVNFLSSLDAASLHPLAYKSYPGYR